ncbi:putative late blight resistance protein like protein r1b-14 [Quercus suber]|uniref:Late blight resistance protein like protein r1b-14 n=1 Tax=Quercus suber TaxID=58331 RepID=A0AAW0K6U1_QUESU
MPDGKRHDNELVKKVVSQIRDVAYEAEDVIDTFIMTVAEHKRRCKLTKLIHSCDRAIKIERINNVIKEIYNNRSKYGIEIAESCGGDTEAEVKLHRRRRYVEEDRVVGFELKEELLHGLEVKYSSNKDKLKGTLIEDLNGIKAMNDEECKKALYDFLEHIQDDKLEKSLSGFVESFGGVVGLNSPPEKSYLEWLCKSNKLVRVMELSNMGICCLIPNMIENLILLRYLSIRSGEHHVIPDSICNLWNLETLDMRNSIIERLPRGIWKLQKLRHLYMKGKTSLPRTDNKAGLPNLEVLTGIDLNENTESLFAKGRFPKVRKLRLHSSGWRISKLLSSLHPMRHLHTLKICEVLHLSSPGSIQLTLTKITLERTDVGAAMTVLGRLTNLRILKVVGGDIHNTLFCNGSSFHQLEVFKMAKVNVIKWFMRQGAMPRLQRLVLESCKFGIMPPDELCYLTNLQYVEVLNPDPKLRKMLQQLQKRDTCKLHVYRPLHLGSTN